MSGFQSQFASGRYDILLGMLGAGFGLVALLSALRGSLSAFTYAWWSFVLLWAVLGRRIFAPRLEASYGLRIAPLWWLALPGVVALCSALAFLSLGAAYDDQAVERQGYFFGLWGGLFVLLFIVTVVKRKD